MKSNLDMEFWLEKWKERYKNKVRQFPVDKNPLWLDKKEFQNTSNDDDDDDSDDDADADGEDCRSTVVTYSVN